MHKVGFSVFLVVNAYIASVNAAPQQTDASAISLVKSTSASSFQEPAQSISYHYSVTNTGTDTLSNIVVVDNKIPSIGITCPLTTLAPSTSTTCTGVYMTTQGDVDAGNVTNIATASAVNSVATNVSSALSSVTVAAILAPSLELKKSSTTANFNAAGEMINYVYTITNTGNQTLSNLSVADDKILSSAIFCSATTLAPSLTTTCNGSYTTTQADVTAGFVTNTAIAAAQNPQGTAVASSTSVVTVNAAPTTPVRLQTFDVQ